MAAAVTYSDRYSSAGIPAGGRPFNPPHGPWIDDVTHTIPTTMMDDAGDFIHLIPVSSGRWVNLLIFTSAAFDDGTALDADLVLRTTDKDGAHTDTILYNAGTAFEAALTTSIILYPNAQVPGSASGYGSIGWKVNTAATTPNDGAITLFAMGR